MTLRRLLCTGRRLTFFFCRRGLSAPKRQVHESGVPYLYQQLRELDTDTSPFIVETESRAKARI